MIEKFKGFIVTCDNCKEPMTLDGDAAFAVYSDMDAVKDAIELYEWILIGKKCYCDKCKKPFLLQHPFKYTATAFHKEYSANSPGKLKQQLRRDRVSSIIEIFCNGKLSMLYKPQLSRRKRI